MDKQLLLLCFLAAFYTRQTDAAFVEACSDPGALRLYDPNNNLTPYDSDADIQYCDPELLLWSWMCGENWKPSAAKVACHELGYEYDPACCINNWLELRNRSPRKSETWKMMPMSAKDVVCTGEEKRFSDCKIVDNSSPPYNIYAGQKIVCDQVGTHYYDGKTYILRETARTRCSEKPFKPDITDICDDPVAPANGGVIFGRTDAGDIAVYTCDSGYELQGEATTTCDFETASFLPAPPTCQLAPKCANPAAPANGEVTFVGNDVGSFAVYTCDSGYELTGGAIATCTAAADGSSASFQPAPPTCQPIVKCPVPVAPADGGVSYTGVDIGDTATYTCDYGFKLIGKGTATCIAVTESNTAIFQPVPPTCQSTVSCPNPVAPANGEVSVDGKGVGATATYTCNSKYKLVGEATATCTAACGDGDTAFQPAPPICQHPCDEEGMLRLADGKSDREGRVEVCSNGVFLTVCGKKWGKPDAVVVCKQLGHSEKRPIYVRGGVFGEGVGPIFGTEFECSGSEAKLTDCSYSSKVKGCTHNDDAGVICNEKSG